MSQKYLDLAGLTAYDTKIKTWSKTSIVDITDDAINSLFVISTDGPWVTFTAQEDNSSIGLNMLSPNQTLEYSTDTTIWNTFDTTTNISINNGDKMYVRGMLNVDNDRYGNYSQFKMSGKIAASGNCNAIWNYQDLNAPLKNFCGYYMFKDCTSLTAAPELPATTLADSCYEYIFSGCTSLTAAPELPATTLTGYCYSGMFYGCTSLSTAPELPATTLTESCYSSMLNGCSSLTTAPELPATTLADSCYRYMFYGCTSLSTAPELPATTLANNCYQYMFRNCTSLTTAPELPATKLTSYCYRYMFYGCSNLNYIKCLATDVSTDNRTITTNWTKGVSSTGTFFKHSNAMWWSVGVNGIPSDWTIIDA